MKKSIFPGVEIKKSDEFFEITERILSLLALKPIDYGNGWERLGLQWCESNFIPLYDEFYIFYKHIVHDFKDELFRAKNSEVYDFMKEYIIPEKETGLDIFISSLDMKCIVVCNHDGDIFLARYDNPIIETKNSR